MKIKKVHELNEGIINTPASEIIDEIEELSNYDNLDSAGTMQDNLERINDLISDLRFQCD